MYGANFFPIICLLLQHILLGSNGYQMLQSLHLILNVTDFYFANHWQFYTKIGQNIVKKYNICIWDGMTDWCFIGILIAILKTLNICICIFIVMGKF